tara:strand:- start:838 stop:1053 length:216 start_codon:yes stop_codon:yes gene_type:complete
MSIETKEEKRDHMEALVKEEKILRGRFKQRVKDIVSQNEDQQKMNLKRTGYLCSTIDFLNERIQELREEIK